MQFKSSRKSKCKIKTTSRKELLVVIGLVSVEHHGAARRDNVALRAGYGGTGSAKSSAFRCALGRLEKSGYLQDLRVHRDQILLTEEGCRAAIKHAATCSLACTNQDVQLEILQQLTPTMTCLFRLVQDGQHYSRDYLAKALGYINKKAGGFQTLLSRMHCKGYLDFIDKNSVQLSDTCFPFGRSNQHPAS
jgi:hypothetical protein